MNYYLCRSGNFYKTLNYLLSYRQNWKEIEDIEKAGKEKEIAYIHVDDRHQRDPELKSIHNVIIRNEIKGKNAMLDKFLMYDMIVNKYSRCEFIPFTVEIDGRNIKNKIKLLFDYKQTWILKASRGWGGKSVKIVKEFDEVKRYIRQNKQFNKWVLQKYLTDQLLINGHKFHIRLFILVVVNGRDGGGSRDRGGGVKVSGYYYPEGYIYRSSKKFNLNNTKDMTIHLSNISQGGVCETFPDHFEVYFGQNKTKLLVNRIKTILRKSIDVFAGSLRLYQAGGSKGQEQRVSYELFGVDIMVTSDFKPILIEFNCQLGWKHTPVLWRKVLLDNIIQTAIDPIFPPKRPSNGRNKFQQFY